MKNGKLTFIKKKMRVSFRFNFNKYNRKQRFGEKKKQSFRGAYEKIARSRKILTGKVCPTCRDY